MEKNRADTCFDREELGALLRLFSTLGVTVAVGIVGFFLLGLYVERKLALWGFKSYGIPGIILLFSGLAMTIYWAYLKIAKHLDRFGNGNRKE